MQRVADDLTLVAGHTGSWYEVKLQWSLGPDEEDREHMAMLNGGRCWTEGELELRADSRHAEDIMKGMGLTIEPKGLAAPGRGIPARARAAARR